MKLYATIKSERATKGQGGNTSLHIELFAEPDRKIPVGDIIMTQCVHEKPCHIPRTRIDVRKTKNLDVRVYDLIETKNTPETKGKQQKGECGCDITQKLYCPHK